MWLRLVQYHKLIIGLSLSETEIVERYTSRGDAQPSASAVTTTVIYKTDDSPPPASKLALSLPEDFSSPPLKAVKVNLEPSPEFHSLPLPASPPPDGDTRTKGRKRGRGNQPTRGDAVLVNFIGNQNHPDIAQVAGEDPLIAESSGNIPESPVEGGLEEEMDVIGPGALPIKQNLERVAQSSLCITENDDSKSHESIVRSATERPGRPTILTGRTALQNGGYGEPVATLEIIASSTSGVGHDNANLSRNPFQNGRSAFQQIHTHLVNEKDSITTSPQLQEHAIIASEGSPMEDTLPAMQTSPGLSANSPGSQQSLPSLQSQLGSLADRPLPPQPIALSSRQPSFSAASALHSPPQDFASPRGPPPYPLSARTSVSFSTGFPATEPSPASTQSGPSPREPFASGQTPRSMSPPLKFGPRQYTGTQGLTPSDISTPISASSQASYRSLGTEPSPVSERMVLDSDRPTLPPLTNGPLVTSGFKCDHPGCALAFATQYLLNSHANVHSSDRPHYCPVPKCARAEGGKGFKRKNEMIRHGLVHQSPGYICPFCPEREHKYPRPDNLQRHVRVHHVDKDKDDPLLRDVLSHRPEGGIRSRRKRANS